MSENVFAPSWFVMLYPLDPEENSMLVSCLEAACEDDGNPFFGGWQRATP